LLDRSGSMDERANKKEGKKTKSNMMYETLQKFVDSQKQYQLDTFTVIGFHSEAKILI
jgi:hypothetical protein